MKQQSSLSQMLIPSNFSNKLSSIHAKRFKSNSILFITIIIILGRNNDSIHLRVLSHRFDARGIEVVSVHGPNAHANLRRDGGERKRTDAGHDVDELVAALQCLRHEADVLVGQARIPVDLVIRDVEDDAVLLDDGVVVGVAGEELKWELAELGGDGLGLVDDGADGVLGGAVEDDAGDELLVGGMLLGDEVEVDDVADLLEARGDDDAIGKEAREDLGGGVVGVGKVDVNASKGKEGIKRRKTGRSGSSGSINVIIFIVLVV